MKEQWIQEQPVVSNDTHADNQKTLVIELWPENLQSSREQILAVFL